MYKKIKKVKEDELENKLRFLAAKNLLLERSVALKKKQK